MFNCTNPYQGEFKRVLCVCSAGLLRSPTAAEVLSQEPYNCNTRAVGIDHDHALIPIDEVMINWADEIVCMSPEQAKQIELRFPTYKNLKVTVLGIPDQFAFRSPKLIELIKLHYDEQTRIKKEAPDWRSKDQVSKT